MIFFFVSVKTYSSPRYASVIGLTGDLSIYTAFDPPLFFIGQCLSGKKHCEICTVKIFGTTVKKKAKRSNKIISETSNLPVINLYMYICAFPPIRILNFFSSMRRISPDFLSVHGHHATDGEKACALYMMYDREC